MNHKELKTACQEASARGRAKNREQINAQKRQEKARKQKMAPKVKSKSTEKKRAAAQKRRETEAKRRLLARALKILAKLPAAMQRIAAQGGNSVTIYTFKHPDASQYAIDGDLMDQAEALRRVECHPNPPSARALYSPNHLLGLAKIVYDFLDGAGLSPELDFVSAFDNGTQRQQLHVEIRVSVIRSRSRR